MASPIQATGVGSGLDVSGLVDKLMSVEQQPITKLDNQKAAVNVKIGAYATFRSTLSTFQGSLVSLEQASVYNAAKATVGDKDVATASSNSGADAGTHTLEVTSLAQAQRIKSGGNAFSAISDPVGTGSLTIKFGSFDPLTTTFTNNADRGSKTITIDSGHSTLAGVRDAINGANIGVTASIVNDGSGFRLVLGSKDTGAKNGISISVGDDDNNLVDGTGLSRLAFDPTQAAGPGNEMSELLAAKDADFKVDGLQIKKASNTVNDVLQGTTINLLKTNVGSPTSLTVEQDTSQVSTSVDAFVKVYNDLNKSVSTLTSYDADSKKAGVLNGDSGITSLAQQIRSSLSQLVTGSSAGYKALTQVGISLDRTGNLTVDSTKLTAALKKDPAAVQTLFATTGKSDDSLATYNRSGSATPAGKYALSVSQLATQGKAVGALSVTTPLTIDGSNDALTVALNGVTGTVTLKHANYANAGEIATEIQSQLNGAGAFSAANISAKVTESAGVLTISSNTFGSTSKVGLVGGTAQALLFGSAPTTSNGIDVAGSFNGVTATGSGQDLVNDNGLVATISGGNTGSRGTINFTRGIAVQLDDLIGKALGTKGLIATKTDTLNGQVKDIDAKEEKLNTQLAAKKERYTAQFNSLDQMISNMNSQMSYMTQQLSALNK